MKQILIFLVVSLSLFSCQKSGMEKQSENVVHNEPQKRNAAAFVFSDAVVKPNHIFYVWMENKGFNSIIGSFNAPYINSLAARGTLFTNTFALTHPSYPNYIAFFSGSQQGVTGSTCIDNKPFNSENLYTVFKAKGITFRWYSEGLPYRGYTGCKTGRYVERHNPTTIFSNVSSYCNEMFTALKLQDTSTFKSLPQAVCVTPNLDHDMHDGTVRQGDDWLKANFSKLIDWCMVNNSIFVVYFDESENTSAENRIPVVMLGEHIQQNVTVAEKYNHYSFARFTGSVFGTSTTWHPNISNATIPTGFWR